MIVTTADLFRVAYGKFAIGAYNINNMEQALGLFRGHIDAQAPFIIQISKGARKYAGIPMIEAIIRGASAHVSRRDLCRASRSRRRSHLLSTASIPVSIRP